MPLQDCPGTSLLPQAKEWLNERTHSGAVTKCHNRLSDALVYRKAPFLVFIRAGQLVKKKNSRNSQS
jgi:hypothetical protein